MEVENWTDSETESVESSAGELADEAKDFMGDSSSEYSLSPAKSSCASYSEESEHSDHMHIDTDVEETSTDGSETSDVEISPVGTPDQDIADATAVNINILLLIRERWKASETARTYRKTRRERNTFTVFDECLEQVENESVGLRNLFLEVLENFDLENKRQMVTHLSRDCLYPQRFQAVEDYLRGAYHSFPVKVDVTSGPEQVVKKSSRGGSADEGEGNRTKRKMDSEVSTKAAELEELEGVQDKEKREETAVESTKDDVKEASTGGSEDIKGRTKKRKLDFGVSVYASNTNGLQEVEDVEKLAEIGKENNGEGIGTSVQIGLGDACTGKGESENTEGDVRMSPTVPLSSTCYVTSEQYVEDLKGANVEILHKIMSREDTQLRKLELTCDFLLISAKCVAFVVAQALNTHALCPLLLKMTETGVGRDNSKYTKVSMVLVTFYTGLALEALEAAVQYHRSASSYLAEALGLDPVVNRSGKLGEDVLSQVIHTSREVQELDPHRPSVNTKSGPEIRPLVEALACILSPALRRVKEANTLTKDAVETLDSDRLHKAMEVTVKGATYYTLFVISEMKHGLSMLSGIANYCAESGLVETATGQVNVPQGENGLQVQMEAVAGNETVAQIVSTVEVQVDASAMYKISVHGENPVKVRVEAVAHEGASRGDKAVQVQVESIAVHENLSQGKNTRQDHVEAAVGSFPQGENVQPKMEVAANDGSSQVENTEQGQVAATGVLESAHQGENTVQEEAVSVNGNDCQGENTVQAKDDAVANDGRSPEGGNTAEEAAVEHGCSPQGENTAQSQLDAADTHGSVLHVESTEQYAVEVADLHANVSLDLNAIQGQMETVVSSLQGENVRDQMEVAANHGCSPQVNNTEQGQGASTAVHRSALLADNTVKVQEETLSVIESDCQNENSTQGQDDAVTKDGRSPQGENTVEVQMEAAVEHGKDPQGENTEQRQLDASDRHGSVPQGENTVQCETEVASLRENASQDVYTIEGQVEAVARNGCAPQGENSVQIQAETDAGQGNALQSDKIVQDQLEAAAGHGSSSQVENTLIGQVETAAEDGIVPQAEKAVQDEVATGHSSPHDANCVQAQVVAPVIPGSVVEGENSVPVEVETAAGLGRAPKGENSVQTQVEEYFRHGSASKVERSLQSQVEAAVEGIATEAETLCRIKYRYLQHMEVLF